MANLTQVSPVGSFEDWDTHLGQVSGLRGRVDPRVLREEYRKSALALAERPMFREYQAFLDAEGEAHNTEPWHAIGDQLVSAFMQFSVGSGVQPTIWDGLPEEADQRGRSGGMATMLMRAVPYLWENRYLDLADASPELPPHVISRKILQFPVTFWSFETCRVCPAEMSFNRVPFEFNWMLIVDRGYDVLIANDVRYGSYSSSLYGGPYEPNRVGHSAFSIPYGKRYPDDFDAQTRDIYGIMLKRFAFLNSPYVTVEESAIPRPIRRRDEMWARKSGQPARAQSAETIRVITLRREVEAAIRGEREARAGGKATRAHWVRSHHKAQWYPLEEAHHVIWIAPYLRARAAGLPVAPHVYRVSR